MKTFIIKLVERQNSDGFYGDQHRFMCPWNSAITGRGISLAADGKPIVTYQYGILKAFAENGEELFGEISFINYKTVELPTTSDLSGEVVNGNRVIVGIVCDYAKNYMIVTTAEVTHNLCKITEVTEAISSRTVYSWYQTDYNHLIAGWASNVKDTQAEIIYKVRAFTLNNKALRPAPKGAYIAVDERFVSDRIKESNGNFKCPTNMVITGRVHNGDENGYTRYEYASLKALSSDGLLLPGDVTIINTPENDSTIKESDENGFDAPVNHVIIGRHHNGDENGNTTYLTGKVLYNGFPTYTTDYQGSAPIVESAGIWYNSSDNHLLVGRRHYGDENGYTIYRCASLLCHPTKEADIDIILHLYPYLPNDGYTHTFPMDPMDFIRQSRFRQHITNGRDLGFDKNIGDFTKSDSLSSNFFDIPVDIIALKHTAPSGSMVFYNMRPRDKAALNSDNQFFLQPFRTRLDGDRNPTGRVPVFTHSYFYVDDSGLNCEMREYWYFFGYNPAPFGNHQGDWEGFTLDIAEGKIRGAWLNQHTGKTYYPASSLEIANNDGKQVLTLYNARGSHATYKSAGTFHTGALPDKTVGEDSSSVPWHITKYQIMLSETPWHLYAGGWGEVGEQEYTTGPLGPWYKRFDYQPEYGYPSLTSILSSNEVLLIPKSFQLCGPYKESVSEFYVNNHQVVTGRRHSGDENGTTFYEVAQLKAINYKGETIPGEITVTDHEWHSSIKESDSSFRAPAGRVITGRRHTGDENGMTQYRTSVVRFRGKPVGIVSTPWFAPSKYALEPIGAFFKTHEYCVWIGRDHSHDENGKSTFYQGYLKSRI